MVTLHRFLDSVKSFRIRHTIFRSQCKALYNMRLVIMHTLEIIIPDIGSQYQKNWGTNFKKYKSFHEIKMVIMCH